MVSWDISEESDVKPPLTDTEVIEQARDRAVAGLPPEGVTIVASDPETMRHELFALFLDDAEHAA